MTGFVSKSEPGESAGRTRRLAVAAVLIGALIGTVLSALAADFERRLIFDAWQRIENRELATDDVVVVLIDDTSVELYGQWPWSRLDLSALIEKTAEAEPAVIGVDMYFPQADPSRPEAFVSTYEDAGLLDEDTKAEILALPNWDDRLAYFIGSTPTPIVLARATLPAGGVPADELFYTQMEGVPPEGTMGADNVLKSIDELDGVASATAFVDGMPDKDGVVRRVPLAIRAGDATGAGFAIELARQKRGVHMLRWEGQQLLLGDSLIPSDRKGNLQFKMARYDDAYEAKIIPAFRVLSEQLDPELLRGKIVILGVAATGTYDIVATPMGAEVPGTVVQAQAVDAILKGEWLSYPGWVKALEVAAAAILVALLLGAAVTFRNRFILIAAVVAIALPVISLLAYLEMNLLFDPARPLLIGILGALGLLIARYAIALQELVQQRIREAEQKREEESARKLQLRMVPSPARLAELGRRTEIGAVLVPARSVGGDFYDAFELSRDRLLFLVGDVSGKGLGAALFMAFSKTAAKAKFLSADGDLGEAVTALNQELMREEDDEMDLTLLVGLIDCETGRVDLVCAGHEDPLLVRGTDDVHPIKLVGGPRLRTFYDFPYRTETVQMAPGETLVIITDGATDAANVSDSRFGLDGVVASLKAHKASTAQARATDLAEQVRLFEGNVDPADDLTIMAVKYIGPENGAPSETLN